MARPRLCLGGRLAHAIAWLVASKLYSQARDVSSGGPRWWRWHVGLGQHAMPQPWSATWHAKALASSMPCPGLGKHVMPRPWLAACHAPALANLSCHGLGQQHAMPQPWPATWYAKGLASSMPCPGHGKLVMPRPCAPACHANALARSMPCHSLVQQHGMPCHSLGHQHALPWPCPLAWHAPALASSISCHGLGKHAKPRPWQACHVPRVPREKYVPRTSCLYFRECTSWRVSCVWFVRVGRIPACAAKSAGAFFHVHRVIAFRLSSTRLRVACASLVEGASRKTCPSANSTGAFLHVPRVNAFRLSLTRLRVACDSLVEGALRKARANRCLLDFSKCFLTFVRLLSPAGCDSFRAAANSTGAFLFIIRRIPTVALTGACSAYLNVLARSSLVLQGVIRFGRLRTPLVHSSSFVLGGQILPSASRGFLCCLPKEKEFGPYRVPIFASPPRGAGGTPKYLPCCVLSSHVAVSVAWPAGSYARALGFEALCGYTGSSTFVFPPSVRRSLRATAAPASDRVGSVGRAYAVPVS
ncbi:hypothetical protein TEA_029603 [Camellia sinensis var. sinensis]|uniref:Uncharacterized protein n=1 Tax=Camellia sinensis var. sinensis TaxID=542762 RepID=A0A4S4DP81_CAMSN|nr:hypothetical protein TEA_029603 [Camellia sinensis var. sinensis]